MLLVGFKNDNVLYLQSSGGDNIKTATCCPRTNVGFKRVGPHMETFVYSEYKKLLIALCTLFCSLFLQGRF